MIKNCDLSGPAPCIHRESTSISTINPAPGTVLIDPLLAQLIDPLLAQLIPLLAQVAVRNDLVAAGAGRQFVWPELPDLKPTIGTSN